MADLVGARLMQSNPFLALLGVSNETQSNVPAYSNYYGSWGNVTDGALAATGVAKAVAVPMDAGVVISHVSIIVGGTAASTPTHGGAGLYSGLATGAPALLASSADTTTTAIPASGSFSYALSSPYLVKPADVANGYLYVSVFGAGTAVQTAATFLSTTAVAYQWFTSSTTVKGVSPQFICATHGSSLTTAMPSTIASPTAATPAPIVILT